MRVCAFAARNEWHREYLGFFSGSENPGFFSGSKLSQQHVQYDLRGDLNEQCRDAIKVLLPFP